MRDAGESGSRADGWIARESTGMPLPLNPSNAESRMGSLSGATSTHGRPVPSGDTMIGVSDICVPSFLLTQQRTRSMICASAQKEADVGLTRFGGPHFGRGIDVQKPTAIGSFDPTYASLACSTSRAQLDMHDRHIEQPWLAEDVSDTTPNRPSTL